MSQVLPADLFLRLEVQELFERYADTLDRGEFDAWPDCFTEECLYLVIPRENYERDLPLAAVRCESRGMLRDRVTAIRSTMMYQPRYVRHLVSGARVLEAPLASGGALRARANYCVFETVVDDETRILQTGRYEADLAREGGELRFRELACVFDSVIVPNSLVYPI